MGGNSSQLYKNDDCGEECIQGNSKTQLSATTLHERCPISPTSDSESTNEDRDDYDSASNDDVKKVVVPRSTNGQNCHQYESSDSRYHPIHQQQRMHKSLNSQPPTEHIADVISGSRSEVGRLTDQKVVNQPTSTLSDLPFDQATSNSQQLDHLKSGTFATASLGVFRGTPLLNDVVPPVQPPDSSPSFCFKSSFTLPQRKQAISTKDPSQTSSDVLPTPRLSASSIPCEMANSTSAQGQRQILFATLNDTRFTSTNSDRMISLLQEKEVVPDFLKGETLVSSMSPSVSTRASINSTLSSTSISTLPNTEGNMSSVSVITPSNANWAHQASIASEMKQREKILTQRERLLENQTSLCLQLGRELKRRRIELFQDRTSSEFSGSPKPYFERIHTALNTVECSTVSDSVDQRNHHEVVKLTDRDRIITDLWKQVTILESKVAQLKSAPPQLQQTIQGNLSAATNDQLISIYEAFQRQVERLKEIVQSFEASQEKDNSAKVICACIQCQLKEEGQCKAHLPSHGECDSLSKERIVGLLDQSPLLCVGCGNCQQEGQIFDKRLLQDLRKVQVELSSSLLSFHKLTSLKAKEIGVQRIIRKPHLHSAGPFTLSCSKVETHEILPQQHNKTYNTNDKDMPSNATDEMARGLFDSKGTILMG